MGNDISGKNVFSNTTSSKDTFDSESVKTSPSLPVNPADIKKDSLDHKGKTSKACDSVCTF